MLKDGRHHVIVCNGRHGISITACTARNALRLVNEAAAEVPTLGHVVATLDAEDGPKVVSAERLTAILAEVIAKAPGDDLPLLRDLLYGSESRDGSGACCVLTQEWQDELVLWCFRHKFNCQRVAELGADELTRAAALGELSFLAPIRERWPNGVQLVARAHLMGAEALRYLRQAVWRDTARESRVVERHVRFLNDWAEGRWSVLEIERCELDADAQ